MRLDDLTGKRFGRLTVVSRAENGKGSRARWLCRCDCGNERVVYGYSLKSGNTRSCGCLRAETSKDKATTHGMSKTSLFHVWWAMMERCTNKNSKSYKNYGGRGISVCDEWLDSTTFFNWALSSGYEEGLTIERIDVNDGYKPSNCKWVTKKEQARNKTNSFIVEIDGESKCLAEWCEIYEINYFTVHQRIAKLGWSPIKALTTPISKRTARKESR